MHRTVSFFISHDFPEGNAKNARIKAYARGILELGIPCVIYVGYSSKFNENWVNRETKGFWEGIPFEFLCGTVKYKPSFFHRFKCWVKANQTALQKLNQKDPHNVSFFYMPTWLGLLPAFVLSARRGKNLVAMQTEQFSAASSGWRRFFRQSEEKAVVNHAQILLTITSGLTRYFKSIAKNNNVKEVTPVVVDHSRFEPIETRTKPLYSLGYVGSFNLKEGMQTMVNASIKARKTFPNLTFKSMGKVTTNLTQPEGVEFTGFFKFDELPNLLESCDALIVNREDTTYSRLGFPIKLGEYLASGRTVFLCDFAEYRRYLDEHEVIYFKPNDEDDLSRKVLHFYRNYSDQTARNGYQKGKKIFSKEVVTAELNGIFDQLN